MALKGGITLKDVYEVVNRLEDKFDEKFSDIETRTATLENNQNKAMGILSLVGIFSGVLASFIWEKITGK